MPLKTQHRCAGCEETLLQHVEREKASFSELLISGVKIKDKTWDLLNICNKGDHLLSTFPAFSVNLWSYFVIGV